MSQLSQYDIAAIRGCVLNGATAEQIYAAFEGMYSMADIRQVMTQFNALKK